MMGCSVKLEQNLLLAIFSLFRVLKMEFRNLDKLKPDEKTLWRKLEKYLRNQHGKIETSYTDLGKFFDDLSTSTVSRRLKCFEKLGLIRLERKGKGRYNLTHITLISYEDSPQEDDILSISPVVGVIPLDSPFYIERASDQKCRQALVQNHPNKRSFVRIKGYRESGKSSLLIRLRHFLECETDQAVALIDLSGNAFQPDSFEDPYKLFYEFTYAVTEAFSSKLQLSNPRSHLKDLWNADIAPSPGLKCTNYLREYVFSRLPQPSTLLIDGVDAVLGHKETQNPLLRLLRTWNEDEMKNVGQGRIVWTNIVAAYSTEPYLAYGIEGSLFQNVGIEVNLGEFDANQINSLARLYKLDDLSEQQLIELINLVGGHPALLQRAFYVLSQKPSNIGTEFSKLLQSSSFFFQGHLLCKLKVLQTDRSEKLLPCFMKILQGQPSSDEFSKFQLEKAGLIKRTENGDLRVIELYRQYFPNVLETTV